MVVVPASDEFQNGFAVGKYEVSVGDYSKYCALSGNCKPVKAKEKHNDPIRGISVKDAETYTKWLTERTGKTYRLPTQAEWEYAATAGGKQPKKDYNCRVALGEKVIKGTGIVSIKSGQANGWGLKNYIGNVQEWVLDGDTIEAHGGAFEDAHSKCEISLERPHSGNPDDSTGFRLVLEEVG
jgi:formylglycine-generating enzyme required for sulfatase activity